MVGSYFGLIPSEHSSGGRQQLVRISKQGSGFMRLLLVEAGRSAARYDAELGRFYRRLAARTSQGGGGAKAGNKVVSDAAREMELCAVMQGRCAG